MGNEQIEIGAWDRNRTGTPFLARDFKSLVSTNFTTQAIDADVHSIRILQNQPQVFP